MLPKCSILFIFGSVFKKTNNMATTKFFLQSKTSPANIYVNLSVSRGKIFRRKTGYTINTADWSEATDLPKQNDEENRRLGVRLKKMAAFIIEELNTLTTEGGEPTGDWLEAKIDAFNGKKRKSDEDILLNYIQKYIEDLPYKEFPNGRKGATRATIQKYSALKNKIDEYQIYTKKTFYVKDVTPVFRNDLLKYFREVLILGANTAGRYIKFLKTVCLDAQFNGLEVSHLLKRVRGFSEKADKIYLTFEELEALEKKTFSRPALDNARDWLIIGCYIGQRVSDLLTLTRENIIMRAGLELIELDQVKTGKQVSIPLHPKVKTIIEKYGGNFPYNISDQRFNEYIKDVCRLAGITQPVKGGKLIEISEGTFRKVHGNYPKYELVTSHICRRSFATNFYGELPTALLISITAHSTEQQFLQYIGKTSNDYAVQIAEYWRKEELKSRHNVLMNVIKKAE